MLNSVLLYLFCFTLVTFTKAEGLTKRPSLAEQNADSLQKMQESFSLLRHRIDNQQTVVKTFEERLLNFETMLEALREDLKLEGKKQKEGLSTKTQSLDLRVASLEKVSEALLADVKQISKSFNEALLAFKGLNQKFTDLESSVSKNGRNLANLQSSVQSLLQAFQPEMKEMVETDSKTVNYKIKNGDSLEKIAKAHNTSVQVIKELNQMSNDKIIVGKTIKIPSSS